MGARVLVTGIGGFVASHVALAALEAGCEVVGTLRRPGEGPAVRAALAAAGAPVARLAFTEADLLSDKGWAAAAAGCRVVHHVAAPLPLEQPRARQALVPAARDGTLRVLDAVLAAGVERIVMTSSIAAMIYREARPAQVTFGEADWTDPDWSALTPYALAKTRAERAAWARVAEAGATARLATVHPGLVLGPALRPRLGASLRAVALMFEGAYPALPPVAWPVVDVRDVARLHLAAADLEAAGGRRLIAAAGTMSLKEIADVLRQAFPQAARSVPQRVAPGFLIQAMARFDPLLRGLLPDLGTRPVADTRDVTRLTGLDFRPGREAVIAAAQSLIDHGLVPGEDPALAAAR